MPKRPVQEARPFGGLFHNLGGAHLQPFVQRFEEIVTVGGGDAVGEARSDDVDLAPGRDGGVKEGRPRSGDVAVAGAVTGPYPAVEPDVSLDLITREHALDLPGRNSLLRRPPVNDQYVTVERISRVGQTVQPVADQPQQAQADQYDQPDDERPDGERSSSRQPDQANIYQDNDDHHADADTQTPPHICLPFCHVPHSLTRTQALYQGEGTEANRVSLSWGVTRIGNPTCKRGCQTSLAKTAQRVYNR